MALSVCPPCPFRRALGKRPQHDTAPQTTDSSIKEPETEVPKVLLLLSAATRFSFSV